MNRISLSTADAGLGLPLVFLHGFPLSRGAWQKQIDAFRSSCRVIAPDFRGFGDSETQPGPTTMAQYAADLHALLQQLKTGPVVLIGHSMGGYVALAFARQFPEMLRGLVLVSTKAGQDSAELDARDIMTIVSGVRLGGTPPWRAHGFRVRFSCYEKQATLPKWKVRQRTALPGGSVAHIQTLKGKSCW